MKRHQKVLFNLALVGLAVCTLVTTAYGTKDDGTKGVICHATGADKFVGSHYLRFIKFGYVEPGAGCPAQ